MLLDCHKACQSVLIRNIKLFVFNLVITSLHNVLDKNGYQHRTAYYLYISINIQSLKMSANDNSENLGWINELMNKYLYLKVHIKR